MDAEHYQHEQSIKLLIVGESRVGKTSLVNRYTGNTFTPYSISTIGSELYIKDIVINNTPMRVTIIDTAGQEKFHSIPKSYYRDVDGILICYDCTYRISFAMVTKWFNRIQECTPPSVQLILIGNKCDLAQHNVTHEEGVELANQFKVEFFLTSAKEGVNVEEAFTRIIEQVLQRGPSVSLKSISLNQRKKKKKCCKG